MARILVVEDDNSLAMEMSWMVEDAGYSVVGPEGSVETARRVLARQRVDLALLDVTLGRETVFPVSEILDRMGTVHLCHRPFAVCTAGAVPPSAIDAQALEAPGSHGAYQADSGRSRPGVT
jgi:DNA-binding NtrC family response regulator